MALGAVEAISGAGKDILVVGFDDTDDAAEAIEKSIPVNITLITKDNVQ